LAGANTHPLGAILAGFLLGRDVSHPEELELLEHGRTGWNRFVGVDHETSPFDRGRIWRGVKPRPKAKAFDLIDIFGRDE